MRRRRNVQIPGVRDLRAYRDTPTVTTSSVNVRYAQVQIVQIAALNVAIRDKTCGYAILDDRKAEETVDLVALVAAPGRRQIAGDATRHALQIRLSGDDAINASQGPGPVECALWAAYDLYSLYIDQSEVGVRCIVVDRCLVEIGTDCGPCSAGERAVG